jgi:DNA polymerase III sliding clamp (beta) subunit (PCNA family)
MREILNIVRGAVSTKDIVPVLTHFYFHEGIVQGGNGKIVIQAPLPDVGELSTVVPAADFLRAIDACNSDMKLTFTDTGRLKVSKGKFKVFMPVAEKETYPSVVMEGDWKKAPNDLVNKIRLLRPFVGDDAVRVWSCGMNMESGYLRATNNITLVRTEIEYDEFPITIPVYALDEIVRINREVLFIAVKDNNIMFDLGDNIYLRAQLFNQPWPDVSGMFKECDLVVPDELHDAVQRIAPFCEDGSIRFSEEGVGTSVKEKTTAQCEGLVYEPCSFNVKQITNILNVATHFDISKAPGGSFKGEDIEGVFMGMRL